MKNAKNAKSVKNIPPAKASKKPVTKVTPVIKPVSRAKAATSKALAKVVEAPTKRKATVKDFLEVSDSNLIVSIDLRRQSNESLTDVEIEEGYRLFPYQVLPRLLVGWQTIGFISSFEMKISTESPFPQITVRFAEKMSPKEVETMNEALRTQMEEQISLVRQFPFVKVESPFPTLPQAGS